MLCDRRAVLAVLLALELHCPYDNVFRNWCTFSLVCSVLHAQNQGAVCHLLQLNHFQSVTFLFYIRTQSVPHSKHSPPRLDETTLLMLHKAKKVSLKSVHNTYKTHKHKVSTTDNFQMSALDVRKLASRL
jgi:hypothetical protein